MQPVQEHPDGTLLRVRVIPNAKKTRSDGIMGSQLKIRLHAPPVDGKANKELTSFIAKTLGIRKSCVSLKSGATSRDKTLILTGVPVRDLERSTLLP